MTSVLDEARGGAAFEDLMLPERGDHEAGLGVVASVARAPPPAQMLGVALALHAAAATAAADSPMTRLHELPSQRYAAYLDASEKHTLALGAKSLRECHAAGRVPSLGTVTVPRHLQGGDAFAARLGSVVLQGGRFKLRVPAGGLPQASVRQELEEVPYNAGALASAGAGVWAVASPSRFRVEVGEPSVEPFGGRFYPLLVSRLLPNLVDGQMVEALPSSVQRPLLSCKLDAIMREASGPGSAAHSLITRGVAIEPSLATAPGDQLFGGGGDVYISSVTNPSTSDMVSSRDLAEVLELLARQGLTPQLRSRLAGFKSTLRSALNGVMLNRAKYTSFSRHYTAYRVLKKIAERLNPLLRPGDTFVDFACGQNSFGGLLRDPLTQQTLQLVRRERSRDAARRARRGSQPPVRPPKQDGDRLREARAVHAPTAARAHHARDELPARGVRACAPRRPALPRLRLLRARLSLSQLDPRKERGARRVHLPSQAGCAWAV
jgi:hypothetical protein